MAKGIKGYTKAELYATLDPVWKETVEGVIKSGSGETIPNAGIASAAFLFDNFFSKCEGEALIFSGEFFETFYRALRDSIKAALDKINNMRVIVTKPEECNYIEELVKEYPTKVGCRKINFPEAKSHFAVFDARMWRMEEEHGEIDPLDLNYVVRAGASFNDREGGTKLGKAFQLLWDCAEPTDSTKEILP